MADSLTKPLTEIALNAPRIGVGTARHRRFSYVVPKLWPLLSSANAPVLAGFAAKFMELPIVEHELLKEETVARPVVVLAMERGSYHFIRDGVRQ